MRKPQLVGWTALVVLANLCLSAWAETPEEKGFAIVTEQDNRNKGYVDSFSDMRMLLISKSGSQTEREMRVKALEGPEGEGDKSLMIFDSPRDQKGTALLTFSHKTSQDDQWLYLPALKRVKKIASENKSGPFVGSEFAFEDITPPEIEKYTYKFLREETVEGQKCYVVESYPKDKYSGYTRIVTWIDQEHYRTLKADFYDRKNELLKSLTNTGHQLYEERFWRPADSFMENHQTGKATRLVYENYKFKNGFNSKEFNKNTLKRLR